MKTSELVILKRTDTKDKTVALVRAKTWFAKELQNGPIPIICCHASSVCVVFWMESGDLDFDIEAPTTLALCRDIEDADIMYEKYSEILIASGHI
jgi:hypothetical protein